MEEITIEDVLDREQDLKKEGMNDDLYSKYAPPGDGGDYYVDRLGNWTKIKNSREDTDMTLNPQGIPKPHERLEATADDILANIYEALFHLSFELQNDIVEKGYELIEDVDEMMGTVASFRERMDREELEKLGEGLKDFKQEDE